MSAHIAIVTLAAGASRRFGSAKQLALLAGKPLIVHSIEKTLNISNCDSYLVLGANYLKIIEALNASGPLLSDDKLLVNNNWDEGMASSIRLATKQLMDKYRALLFVAADQAHISRQELQQLVDASQVNTGSIIAADYNQILGIPALFPNQYYSELLQLTGDKGAKSLIYRHQKHVISIPLASAAKDIDTKADL